MKKLRAAAILTALSLTLCGCGSALLERSYSSVASHSAAYWEDRGEDMLRAEGYQDLINTLLLLIGNHSGEGIIRLYGKADEEPGEMAARACNEVQQETPMGAYLLDYISYSGTQTGEYYELRVRFGYRRSESEQAAIINVTSTEAIPDLLLAAYEQDASSLTLRIDYFATDRAGIEETVLALQCELAGVESAEELADTQPLWKVIFYPDTETPGIIEIILKDAPQ